MANTEVGTAFVTIIPSARGFAKTLQKAIAKEFSGSNLDRMISDALQGARVTIPARAELDTSDIPDQIRGREPEVPVRLDPLMAAFEDELRRELVASQVTVNVPVEGDTVRLRDDITTAVAAVEQTVSADIDTEPGGQVGYERGLRSMVADVARRVRATIHADVEIDKPSLDRLHQTIDVDAGKSVGERIGDSASKGFLSKFADSIKGALPTSPLILAVGAAIGVALLPAISAALTGGLLGGAGLGLIGFGAFILREEPEVKNAATQLMLTVGSVFRSAAIPLIKPITEALEMIRWAVIEWGPQFRTMFELIAPAIKPLTEGLIGLISNMLPGFTELVRQATPFLISLANELPRLGEYIGVFFRIIDGGGPGASQFFSDLITIVGLLVVAVGVVIRTFTELYPVFRFLVAISPIGMFINLIKVIYDARDALGGFIDTGKRVLDTFAKAWQVAIAAAQRKGGELIDFVKGLPGRIVRGLGNLGGLLSSAGRALIQSLINGIRAMVPSLSGTLGWITNMIPSWKGPEDTDRRLLEPTGSSIMGGLIRGIHGERTALESELGSVTTLIADTPLTSPVAGFGASAPVAPAPALLAWKAGTTGDALLDAIQEKIRIDTGGDVQARLGTVSR